jgi:hypothetical protein
MQSVQQQIRGDVGYKVFNKHSGFLYKNYEKLRLVWGPYQLRWRMLEDFGNAIGDALGEDRTRDV